MSLDYILLLAAWMAGLLALFRTVFEPVVKICKSKINKHQHRYKKNSQSRKHTESMKEILTIRQVDIAP